MQKLATLAVLAFALACKQSPEPPAATGAASAAPGESSAPAPAAPGTASAAPAAPGAAASAAPVAPGSPTSASAAAAVAAAASRPSTAGGPDAPEAPKIHALDFQAQPGWVKENAVGSMRAAQYLLPRVEGDDRDATLVVYYFGAQGGGTIESNVDRWIAQLEQPDGSSTRERAKIETFMLGAHPAHKVDATGTYVAETRPGSGEKLNQPGTRMIALVIETSSGSFYPKLLGPEKTVAHWESSFRSFLEQATR